MERVEVSRTFIDGCGRYPDKELINYESRFTDIEKESLKLVLRLFKPKDVTAFISILEFHCQDMIIIIDSPERTEHKENLEYLVKVFKSSLHYLENLQRGKLLLSYTRSITDLNQERSAISKDSHYESDNMAVNLDGLKLSHKARRPLNDLIKTIEGQLEEEKRPRGRPEAYSKGFVRIIAEIYIKHLEEKPTAYPDGPFVNVVRIALEAVGLPSKDPLRSVRDVLKNA